MRHAKLLTTTLFVMSPFALAPFAGCGGDDGNSSVSSSSSTTSSSSSGGDGGAAGSGGSGGGGDGGAAGSGGSSGVDGEPAGHLLISEIAVDPGATEFIEIWNPTATAVDLSNYYISDNAVYYKISSNEAWVPAGTAGSDFLTQFPAGATIEPGAYIVIATDSDFEVTYMKCADYGLTVAPIPCNADAVPPMVAPANGGLGTSATGLLTNDGEMIVLFQWDGVMGHGVKDVDYVTWGQGSGASVRSDKTGKAGYLPDTPRELQHPATPPGPRQSMSRCHDDLEPGELLTGSNGLNGHDETSEALDVSFVVTVTRTPGDKNACEAQ